MCIHSHIQMFLAKKGITTFTRAKMIERCTQETPELDYGQIGVRDPELLENIQAVDHLRQSPIQPTQTTLF